MKLSKEEIKHVAHLARLELSEEELEMYAKQLPQILDYVNQIQEVVTEDVKPTYSVSGTETMREDKITHPSGEQTREEMLRVSKMKDGEFLKVPGVFDRNEESPN